MKHMIFFYKKSQTSAWPWLLSEINSCANPTGLKESQCRSNTMEVKMHRISPYAMVLLHEILDYMLQMCKSNKCKCLILLDNP